MKKSLLMLGLIFLAAQPAFSQKGCPLAGCPASRQMQPSYQAVQPVYKQPVQQKVQPVYQRAYQPVYMPAQQVYQTAVNPCCPQQPAFYYYNPQCMTGAGAPVCPQKPRSKWRIFVEDYLGFD